MKNYIPKSGNICAVVVAYHPDNNFEGRIHRISSLVDQVVIIDNDSNVSAVKLLRRLKQSLHIRIILNKSNLGIATALNQGVNAALELGYTWGLLFDQDSEPNNEIINILSDCYCSFTKKADLALIGSNYVAIDKSERLVISHNERGDSCIWTEVQNVITSGTLLRLDAYRLIGKFRDEFFIDNVDIEYCLRARKKGFRVILTHQPVMIHNIGTPSIHYFFGKKISVSNHSATRKYYMMRNDIVLMREYLLIDPTKVIKILYSRILFTFFMLFFEQEKKKKIRLSLLGCLDGVTSNFSRAFSDIA